MNQAGSGIATGVPTMKCDSCGVKVSSKGYLGGGVLCNDCAEKRVEENTV